jgi:uncharacterized protein YraI
LNHIDTVTTYGLNALSVSSHQSGKTAGEYITMNLIDTVTSHGSTGMSRRSLLKLMGVGAATLAVGTVGTAEQARVQVGTQQHTSQLYTVSTAVNFRTGPSTSYSIISVISKGATFTLNGQSQNGYASITYQSRSGWVLASLVVAAGSSGSQPTPVISGEAWTISAVNLRSGPSTSHQILRVVPSDAKIGVSTTVQNGFRYVNYQGQTGWMADAYISSTNGGSQPDPVISAEAWTTSAVNLRSGPSTSNQVLRVVPSGAKIGVSTTERNGFLYVSYQGQAGWMSNAYIAYRDGGSQPGDDQGGNYKTTTTALNLRAEPSTSAKILTVMRAGAKVQLLHTQASGFVNVNYNGMQGWAALEYLK